MKGIVSGKADYAARAHQKYMPVMHRSLRLVLMKGSLSPFACVSVEADSAPIEKGATEAH
jgi:hypothetical protein